MSTLAAWRWFGGSVGVFCANLPGVQKTWKEVMISGSRLRGRVEEVIQRAKAFDGPSHGWFKGMQGARI